MDTTTTATAAPWAEHPVGAAGEVLVQTLSTDVRLRAVDGEIARWRLLDGDPDRWLRVETGPGRLEIRPARALAFAWSDDGGTLEVELPRGARARVESASGSIRSLDLPEGRFRTVSGDQELVGSSGAMTAESVSGDIHVTGAGPTALSARSVSGDIDVRAPSSDRLSARTMSGDVRATGRLAGPGPYAFESTSGDLTLATDGPVRLRVTTISGDVHGDVPHIVETSHGVRTLVVGTGGPIVEVRTISGDVRLIRPQAAEPARSSTPAAASEPVEPSSVVTTETAEDRRLAILKALEAGDIDVAEAGRRLTAVEEPA